ncbi:MAG: DUF1217 domain-containing protein [Rhizobiaceae bacterium]
MTTTYTSYSTVSRDLTRSLKAVQNQPEVRREVEYFQATIGSIKTVDEFVSNRRVMNFAMSAFGLKDMAYAKAFVRKILNEGLDDPGAFVNKLADKRYLRFAETFDFKRYGAATTTFAAVQKGVVDLYIRQTLETQAGNTNEGVRLALYFQRNAQKLSTSAEILTDRALTEVAKTVLRLSDAFSLIDIDKQIAVMEQKINVADFKDPAKVSHFLKRFATLWDVENSTGSQSPAVAIFAQGGGTGMSNALMASLAKLRTKT